VTDLAILHLGSPLSYLLAFALPALDAILPAIPSEAALVALGVATAGSTDGRIALLVGLGALGAFLGDNLSYLLGRRFAPAVENWLFSSPKGARRRVWAQNALEHYGARLILVCRFIPGGRTAVTLTCGIASYPRRTFLAATAMAATIWACYAFFIGRLGGKAFDGRPWALFRVAAAAAVALSALVEIGRRAPRWLRSIHPQRTQ
jgi:membrane-associated protein